MRRSFTHYFALLIPLTLADVQFASPAGNAHVEVPNIGVTWRESGKAPSISDLTTYTLSLMVGGNEEDNMVRLTGIGLPSRRVYECRSI